MINHIRVQWPDGSFLPILLNSDATSTDLKNMLRFAFGPNEILQLTVNDFQISNEEDVPMHMYGLKDGDTIQAIVLTSPHRSNGGNRLQKQIDSILLEAAKVSDTHMNQLESTNEASLSEPEACDPDLNYVVHEQTMIIPSKTNEINSSPIPQIFTDADRLEDDESSSQNQKGIYNNQKPPLFNSIEEAGDYFCDPKTDSEWR